MIITIPYEELAPPYNDPAKLDMIWQVGFDYATSTIDAVDKTITDEYGNNETVSIFHFKNYGIKLDNRRNTYELSYGPAGILIVIKTTYPYEQDNI